MSKIEKLTPAQKRRMFKFRQKWLEIGLQAGDVDKKTTEKIITNFYNRIGEKRPYFWHVDSPLTANMVLAILDKINPEINLRAKAWNNLWANLEEDFREVSPRICLTYLWGQVEAYWVAYYLSVATLKKGIYAEEDRSLLEEWAKLTKASFWWWPYKNLCIVSQRPNKIEYEWRGSRIRLHSEDDMAVKFRDGYGLYYWHGVQVPKEVIVSPNQLTKERILPEENTEVRRAMIERVGYEKFIKMIKPTIVDTRLKRWQQPATNSDFKKGEWREFEEKMYRVDLEEDTLQFVHVMDNTTKRTYFLGVPPDSKDIIDALAWTFYLSREEYLGMSFAT